MDKDLRDMLKRARLHHEAAVMAKPKSLNEMARTLNALDNVILYLESQAAPSEPATVKVTEEMLRASKDDLQTIIETQQWGLGERAFAMTSPPAPAGWARSADAKCEHSAFLVMSLFKAGAQEVCGVCGTALTLTWVPTPTQQAGET